MKSELLSEYSSRAVVLIFASNDDDVYTKNGLPIYK